MAKATFRVTEWNGDELRRRVDEACRAGLEATAAAAVAPAMASTPVRTGTAQGSIRFEPAEKRGAAWVVLFGSFNVNYFIWLEIGSKGRAGGYMLQRAVDAEFPKLIGRIRSNLG